MAALPPTAQYTEQDYTAFDMFDGDRDVYVRCRTIKLVAARKRYACFGGECPGRERHDIQPGEVHRLERAIVDGEWGQWRICIPCMGRWFKARDLPPSKPPVV